MDTSNLEHSAIKKICINRNKLINYMLYCITAICTFVVLSILISVIILRKKECNIEWLEYNGNCYKLSFTKELTWDDAVRQCEEEYSSLAQVTEKNAEFFNKVNVGCFWLKNKVQSKSVTKAKYGSIEMSLTFPVITCACYNNNSVIPLKCDEYKPYVCYKSLS
ncbi:SWPV1-262 [Shearwaterpox virus]|uniref:SWPV1-262 n=1 Tax=Shearwaterpox virus TaxID=1974596 RepID=A0A1V0S861_CNPV|nr:SWPV1-262 [Shearwaterpox virus]